jgi:hypothetical protein
MTLLDRLDQWKTRRGKRNLGDLESLLTRLERTRIKDAASLIRLHETLLFLRAYPHSENAARRADAILSDFPRRVEALAESGADLSPLEAEDASGIAGSTHTARFSYEVARRLAHRHGEAIDIDWECLEAHNRMGPLPPLLVPHLADEWPVEHHVPIREWLDRGRPRGRTALRWLLESIERLEPAPVRRAELYDGLQLFLAWRLGRSRAARSLTRIPARLFVHAGPLIPRRAVLLASELDGPPLPAERLPRQRAREILDIILDTSAVRYRELHGFSHPDASLVHSVQAGRGLEIFLFGVAPEGRLPLRAYHAGAFFKNGVPAGYFETLSFFERAEAGFNLYYTFREGESAWIYAQILRACRQLLGVTCFSIDPYQIGHQNQEAIGSGAFWFYRKLGFRSTDPSLERLASAEQLRLAGQPGSRTPPGVLRRLARQPLIYEHNPAEPGAWDRFRIRHLGLASAAYLGARCGGDTLRMQAAARNLTSRALGEPFDSPLAQCLLLIPGIQGWSLSERRLVRRILAAKRHGSEHEYLRCMQRHERLREALLELGSRTGGGDHTAGGQNRGGGQGRNRTALHGFPAPGDGAFPQS